MRLPAMNDTRSTEQNAEQTVMIYGGICAHPIQTLFDLCMDLILDRQREKCAGNSGVTCPVTVVRPFANKSGRERKVGKTASKAVELIKLRREANRNMGIRCACCQRNGLGHERRAVGEQNVYGTHDKHPLLLILMPLYQGNMSVCEINCLQNS